MVSHSPRRYIMPSYQDNREELQKKVVKLRADGFTWSGIAHMLEINSPGTVRKLYEETGNDPHYDLNGKPTRQFEEGEWCKDTCIASEPSAPCNCRCERTNHAGGPAKVIEILSAQGLPQEEIDKRVLEVEKLRTSV